MPNFWQQFSCEQLKTIKPRLNGVLRLNLLVEIERRSHNPDYRMKHSETLRAEMEQLMRVGL